MAVKTTKKSSSVAKGRVVSKDEIEINLKGITARERKAFRVPESDYLALLVGAETFTAASRNKGIVWRFTIDDGKFKGIGPFYYRTMLGDESLWAVRGVLQALDPPVKIPETVTKLKLSKLVGKHAGIRIIDDDVDGKLVSNIDDVFKPGLLVNEEEEEEEGEEEESDDEDEEEYEDGDDEDEESDEEDEDEDEEEDDEEEEEGDYYTEEDLSELGIKELRAIADEFDLDHEGVKKAGIIEGILEAQGADEEDDIELDEEEEDE